MARATGLFFPLTAVTGYYVLLGGGAWSIVALFPGIADLIPVGAIDMRFATDEFTEVLSSGGRADVGDNIASLSIAMVGTLGLMIPVSWVYMLTNRRKDIDSGFIQTIMSLPVVVAGVAMIVQNSFALAFALAGMVAFVRFRITLSTSAQAIYVMASITVGLGAGISALEVSAIVSMMFVYTMMILWKLDYGDYLDGRVISIFVEPSDRD